MLAFLKDGEKRTVLFLCISFAALLVQFFDWGNLPVDAAWIAILLCGIPIMWGAAVGLITAFDVKADLLVSIALIASVITGEMFAAAEVAVIMTVGAYLEERTVAKARAGIEKLVRLTPATARVVRGTQEQVVPADEVRIGDVLRVLAGETIAVDGVVIKGETSVDQSVMTGESLPVDKGPGDEVQSGTVNQFGTFDMTAKKVGEDSSFQRMVRLVESADADKAKIVGMADRWATWIVAIALTSALITGFLTGEAIRAVTILVVFCPCALVLATPAAIMAGIGNAAKHGILISQGDALERLSKVSRIAFDKTGTLTFGRPSVWRMISCQPSVSEQELLRITACAEVRSEHPLGKAITAYYRQEQNENPAQPEAFSLMAGKGVRAVVSGQVIFAGSEVMLTEQGVATPERLIADVTEAKAAGCTIIYVMNERELLGCFALSDTLRPEAGKTVKAIESAGVKTVLLTGDSEQAAGYIADQTEITEVKAACLPEDKLTAIKRYQENGELVCMVGDGINDAAALKAAQTGIAMGVAGSDIAIEAADIVLTGDDIKEIPHLLSLSKRVMRTIHVNIAAAMGLNFIAIALAATGVLGPVPGALIHNVGSVAVIIHSSLLLNWRKR